ncbi:hypothetical protein G7Y89_g2914 [Cudoniella acicularis]|uniref:Uncharacterized protein n=1 Tax=Cudoniella acicularis TaxID=354080 RepID=A0A8H4W5P5_9HELO|nr:hypothetical protein G7Y89_g2914 [Cudoniella acicularis]
MRNFSEILVTKFAHAQGFFAPSVDKSMLSRRIATAGPLRAAMPVARRALFNQRRCAQTASYEYPTLTEAEDPGMNGGYDNPPPVKRQFRDPHADWWDKQERRNYGEPVHEDNDILGMFSPEEYTHVKPGKGLFQLGCFVAAVFTLCGVVGVYYPDKPSAPREFEGGLEKELGGPNAVPARALDSDGYFPFTFDQSLDLPIQGSPFSLGKFPTTISKFHQLLRLPIQLHVPSYPLNIETHSHCNFAPTPRSSFFVSKEFSLYSGFSKMRYQNWDVLVFPDQCKIPLQEFKTACQVIQDPGSLQVNPLLLPTVTSFIPGLSAGAPFRISIHSWQNPEISRYIQNMRKPTDHVLYEARVFVDGRIAGSKWFNQNGPWPTILELSIDLDKHGEFEKLKFPTFHKELLSQSYWNAGDDLGRIKVLIAEGFSRDNLTYPFERVKNLVSFSFQHAPLDVLEASSIAWPNAAMWRQVSLVGPYFAQHFSPRHSAEDVEVHSHSPRHGNPPKPAPAISGFGSLFPQNGPVFPRQPTFDPFTDPTNSAFTGWRQVSSSADVSMPDYASNSRSNSSRQVTDPMSISAIETQDRRFENMQMAGAYESLCESLIPSVPVNTPQNIGTPVQTSATTATADANSITNIVAAVDAIVKVPGTAAEAMKSAANVEIVPIIGMLKL